MRLHDPLELVFRSTGLKLAFALLCILLVAQRCAAQDRGEFPSDKFKLNGFWTYSNPFGVFRGANNPTNINPRGILHFMFVTTKRRRELGSYINVKSAAGEVKTEAKAERASKSSVVGLPDMLGIRPATPFITHLSQ